MRAALLFVLASLLAGGAFREWRRSNEVRFQDLVASLEAEGSARSVAGPDVAGARPMPSETAARRGPADRARKVGGTQDAAPRPASLDPDRATAADWERLPGIGPTLAKRIVADRAVRGPFGGAEALLRVPGIGPRTLARIRAYLVDRGPASADTLHAN